MTTTMYNATVTACLDPVSGTRILRVKPDGELFSYEPGQYTILGLHRSSSRIPDAAPDDKVLADSAGDPLIRRAYSITSNSGDDELEFVVTLVHSGALTPRLFNLREGSRIYLGPDATGAFTLERSSGNRDLLLVATGSAVAPYLSMLRSDAPHGTEQQYVVLHVAAVSWDLAFRAPLEELARLSPNFTYIPAITQPDLDVHWKGLVGTAEELLAGGEIEDELGLPVDPERFDAYLSGSPEMIDSVTSELEKRGYTLGQEGDPDSNILVEWWWRKR